MDESKYEYQSGFARCYYGRGKMDGRLEIVLRQLAKRYGTLSDSVAARVRNASTADLEQIAERVLTAQTLDEALGKR
jgi:hypothetical protein